MLELGQTFLVKEYLDILLPSITKLFDCFFLKVLFLLVSKNAEQKKIQLNLCQACALSHKLSSDFLRPN